MTPAPSATWHQTCAPDLFIALLWTRSAIQYLSWRKGPKTRHKTQGVALTVPSTGQQSNHFPSPAGHAIFNRGQDAIGLLVHLGTPLAHIQSAVDLHSEVLFWWATFKPLFSQPSKLHGVVVHDPAFCLTEPHTCTTVANLQLSRTSPVYQD